MQKKRIVLILVSCLIAAGASFGVTYSVLLAKDSAVNELSVRKNEIEVVEEFKPPAELKHGTDFTKRVQVKNTGGVPCYVRARVIFSDSAMENICELDFNLEKWEYRQEDGYYYYTEPLPLYEEATETAEEKGITMPLFSNVHITGKEDEDNSDLINFDIMVYAESREAKNIIDEDGKEIYESYRQAWNLEGE